MQLARGGDAELRERVEGLLRANDAAPQSPVVAATMRFTVENAIQARNTSVIAVVR